MYIKLINNVPVRYTIGQLIRDNPQVSFPKTILSDILIEYGVYPLKPTKPPEYIIISQKLEEGTPVFQNNEWLQTWVLVNLNTEERALALQNLQNTVTVITQQYLDDFARTRDYDSILSACSYATSSVAKFQKEAQYCAYARDVTWAKLYEIFTKIENGNYSLPISADSIISNLPVLTWPT